MKCGGLPWCDPGGCSVAVLRLCVWIYASRRSTTQVMIVSAKSHPALVSGSHAPHFLPLSSLSHCSSSRQILLTRNKMENTHIAQGMSVDRGARVSEHTPTSCAAQCGGEDHSKFDAQFLGIEQSDAEGQILPHHCRYHFP